jgi:hypothetical protein
MTAQAHALRMTMRRLALVAMAFFAACAPIDDEGNIDTDIQGLTGAARRPRLQRIRDVAAAAGLTNGVLLAGIAQVETGLSHCWSEATWACRGPNSTSCGGGPVIAGASDGPCSAQQGGLGMFQFDGGNFTQTLARDGRDILTLDGNIRHAVDFVVNIVNQEVDGVDNRAEALAWMNGMTVARTDARFTRWVAILACRYNGACGSASQAARYRDATLSVQSEVGAAFWRICAPSTEVCNGRDDDCDGRVDDGISAVSCGVGACRRTVSCTGGRMATCTAGRPGAEACNGGRRRLRRPGGRRHRGGELRGGRVPTHRELHRRTDGGLRARGSARRGVRQRGGRRLRRDDRRGLRGRRRGAAAGRRGHGRRRGSARGRRGSEGRRGRWRRRRGERRWRRE